MAHDHTSPPELAASLVAVAPVACIHAHFDIRMAICHSLIFFFFSSSRGVGTIFWNDFFLYRTTIILLQN